MSEKNNFLKQFDDRPALFPIQGEARAHIHNGLDFPTTRNENWKYTRVAPLISGQYANHQKSVDSIEPYKTSGNDAIYVVFVNGLFSEEHSSSDFPKGLNVHSMRKLEGSEKAGMLTHLGQYVDTQNEAFTALNTGYFADGSYITVDANATIEKPVCILHLSVGVNQASNVRNLILLGKNSKASFITQFNHIDGDGGFTNAITEVSLDENASGALYLLQDEGDTSAHINTTHIRQQTSSKFTTVTITKSGKLVRNNLRFNVEGSFCESNMYGVYFTSDKQHVDNHTFVDHQKPSCTSNELYKGVMGDRSTAVFNGKIMVRRDAQQTNAFQSNQNILLTDSATINTKPELEIYADDVKCSHGCTIGQLDEEAMFYLQSRGVDRTEATKMLLQAFAAEVIDHIAPEALRENVSSFIQQKFQGSNA